MRLRLRFLNAAMVLMALMIGCLLIWFRTASAQRGGTQPGEVQLSATAKRQIQALIAEKRSRSAAMKKVDSQLIYAIRELRGQPLTPGGEVRSMASTAAIAKEGKGMVEVDIKGVVNRELIMAVRRAGGDFIYSSEKDGVIRARVPLESVENLAALSPVRTIRLAAQRITHRQLGGAGRTGSVPKAQDVKASSFLRAHPRPDFNQRAANIRRQLTAALAKARPVQDGAVTNSGSVSSTGDTAHGAVDARNFFGVNGAGVKIGVLSDGVTFLEQSVASGNLPPDVTVLPGQAGSGGEGTAMLEIVHDVAPGAKLYFATAFTSIESFANNIRALRGAGCDIIVDDIIYFVESPFHDDIVSSAVVDVTAGGALYFSSAGNEGNVSDGTSGTWEGDFKDSSSTLALLPGGTLHDFGNGVISNRIEASSGLPTGLWWSDPLGASNNDYDLILLDNTLTSVVAASTTVQDGDDDPIELINGSLGNLRVVIFKADGAEVRALHLNVFRGELGITTTGTTRGHNSVAAGYGVAAVDAAAAGGGLFTGGPTNPVELFSADGPRRVFFKSDGTPFTPGNLLFSSGGGELRQKPDLTGADGVATSVPGFGSFFGTSAAAPHVAAIAGLLKSANPALTPGEIREVLTSTALDIEAPGVDPDSGAGIVDAFISMLSVGASPSPLLEVGTVAATGVGGDGDTFIEPGESGRLTVPLVNIGGATAVGIKATLSTSTPGVTITSGSSNYSNIGSNGQSANNLTPFTFTLADTAPCGLLIDFTLTVSYLNSSAGPQTSTFRVQSGELLTLTASFTGPPAPIPANTPAGVNIPIVVSGLTSPVAGLKFRFDGSSCTANAGATTVGLDHSWMGDVTVRLTSPQGTTVTLMTEPGGTGNSGNNFCNTVLDDAATILIQSIAPAGAPWTGTFKPANPLAAFNGEDGNGTWMLNVSDIVLADTGSVRAFSLVFSIPACGTGAP